ncbi:MAG TPA: oxygenase MpaB family protein [Acidimicrobiales bacterium]|nr:oxygenase MpaB family protein [Acidimicrobiales bacterium]
MSDPVAEALAALADPITAPLRRHLSAAVRRALGASPGELDEYREPAGDAGLFGPDSIAWRVHADLPAMLIGGLSALLHQTLHPLAMAGVAAHSRFREDPYGRLQRTARFIAGTTFGATPFAERLVGEVRAVHERVRGTAPDGRRYSAGDPALLTFVHSTEVWAFLRSYQRHSPRPLVRAEKDRYLAEVAVIGERLGAERVPRDVAAVRDYFRAVAPELAFAAEAEETVRFLLHPRAATVGEAAGYRVLLAAAVALLPPEARRQLRFSPLRGLLTPASTVAANVVAHSLRWSVGPSAVAAIARARVAAPASHQHSVL